MDGHRLSSSFVLGYHGCNIATAKKLIDGAKFKKSKNPFDWLGHGIYFWEANPERAISYMKEAQRRKGLPDNDISVVGAVIDLGYCLDLLSETNLELVKDAFFSFKVVVSVSGAEMPVNVGGDDLRLRHLDCAVINYLHSSREEGGLPSFETVRGLFVEGGPLFDGSGFMSKNHIQICVRNTANIKGVFKVF